MVGRAGDQLRADLALGRFANKRKLLSLWKVFRWRHQTGPSVVFFFVCLFFLLIINREQNTSFGGNAEMGLLSEKEDSSPGVQ